MFERQVRESPDAARAMEDPEAVEALGAELQKLAENTALAVLDTLLENAPQTLRGNRELRADFQRKLAEVWGDALDLVVGICLEAGDDFNRRNKDRPELDDDHSFHALVRLHARCASSRKRY